VTSADDTDMWKRVERSTEERRMKISTKGMNESKKEGKGFRYEGNNSTLNFNGFLLVDYS
jgi:hypothetical protein